MLAIEIRKITNTILLFVNVFVTIKTMIFFSILIRSNEYFDIRRVIGEKFILNGLKIGLVKRVIFFTS